MSSSPPTPTPPTPSSRGIRVSTWKCLGDTYIHARATSIFFRLMVEMSSLAKRVQGKELKFGKSVSGLVLGKWDREGGCPRAVAQSQGEWTLFAVSFFPECRRKRDFSTTTTLQDHGPWVKPDIISSKARKSKSMRSKDETGPEIHRGPRQSGKLARNSPPKKTHQ